MTSLEHGFTDEDDLEKWPEERIDTVGTNGNDGLAYRCSGCLTLCDECKNEDIALSEIDFGPLEEMDKIFKETINKLDDILNNLLHLNGEYVKIRSNEEGVFALLDDNSLFCIYERN